MTNEKKLELTLCGMFSHKLQLFGDKEAFYGLPKVKSKIITSLMANNKTRYVVLNRARSRDK